MFTRLQPAYNPIIVLLIAPIDEKIDLEFVSQLSHHGSSNKKKIGSVRGKTPSSCYEF